MQSSCNYLCTFVAKYTIMDEQTKETLRQYAQRYETRDFLNGDPSWFMHQVDGDVNRETMAFIAASLSYGSRPVFMKKIKVLLDDAHGDMFGWTVRGIYKDMFRPDDQGCFYRFYTNADMYQFLSIYQTILVAYGSLKAAVSKTKIDGYGAIVKLCSLFNQERQSKVIPRDASSACKRLCMFLRWMVRTHSSVDLGLWSDIIDRRTLIMPLDTHVLQQSRRLGLLQSNNASMATARRLTSVLSTVFPDDPLLGDFALFGEGVNK